MHPSQGITPDTDIASDTTTRVSLTRKLLAIALATAGGVALHVAVLPLVGDRPTFVPTLLAVLVAACAAGGMAGIGGMGGTYAATGFRATGFTKTPAA